MAVMRCKFKLNSVRAASMNDNGKQVPGVTVQLGAVYADANPNDENAIFGKYTPHGSYEATIYNPALVEALPKLLGREFYLDFHLVE